MRHSACVFITYSFSLLIGTIVMLYLIHNNLLNINHHSSLAGCKLKDDSFGHGTTVDNVCMVLNETKKCIGSIRCCQQCMSENDKGSNVTISFVDHIENTFQVALAIYIVGWIACLVTVCLTIYRDKMGFKERRNKFTTAENHNPGHSALLTFDNDKMTNTSVKEYKVSNIIIVSSIIEFVLLLVPVIMIIILFFLYLTPFDCPAYIGLTLCWFVFFLVYIYFLADSICFYNKEKGKNSQTFCNLFCMSCVSDLLQKLLCWSLVLIILCVAAYVIYNQFKNKVKQFTL